MKLKLRSRVKFFAALFSGNGTAVRKDGLAAYVDLDYAGMQDVGPSADPGTSLIALQSTVDGSYTKSTITNILGSSFSSKANVKDPVFGGVSPISSTIYVTSGAFTGYMQALSANAVLLGTTTLTPLIFTTNGFNRGSIPSSSGDWLFGNPTVTQGTISLAGATSGSVKIQGAAAAVGTWTLPNATDTFVGQAATATLTNKTFDTAGTGNNLLINGLAATANTGTGAVVRSASPNITAPTGIVKSDVGLANVDNTSDATKWAATATLTNKTFDTAGAGNSLLINGVAATANSGTGAIVRSSSPNITTPTGIVKGDVGLGNVDNTSDANKPVSTAQAAAIALKANIASPTFTGVPAAPTATPGTNTTQIASTAFVQAAVSAGVSGVASLNGQTGALVSFFPPQGRLTLVSATPVMGSSVAGSTTIFYTPFAGNMVPIYDGSNMIPTVVAEIAQATTDATKSPAAVAANSIYDLFVWNDGGTIRLSRGPAWTNDTTRSAGTALTIVNGIALNNVSITNGPAASRGTYVGTVASNSSSTIDFIYGGLGAGGVAAVFGVWNAYNRVLITTTVKDSNANWTYTVANTWRAPDAAAGSTTGSATYRVTAVRGSDVDFAEAYYSAIGIAGSSSSISSGIGLDSTTTPAAGCFPGFLGSTPSSQQHPSSWTGLMGLGRHYLTPLEFTSTSTAGTFLGTVSANIQAGFKVSLWQ